jgi:hypothetical protein
MRTTLKLMASVLIASLFALALSACNNSQITESYVDPGLRELDLDGVLVVAVTQEQSARANFEDAFVKALSRHNVRAQASHELVPLVQPSADDIIAAAQQARLETILVTRYVGEKSEDVYHPGIVYYDVAPAYGAGYYRGFDSYYGRAYEVAYQQPVWTANVTHTLVSDLYITESRDHMWQAVSDTVEASGTNKLRNDAIHALIGNLKDQGLLN